MKNVGSSFLALTTVAALAGCTTVEFVRKDTSPIKQGVLRHTPTSSADKAKKYRAEVDKQATQFCGGKYRITKEYEAKDIGNNRSWNWI